MSAFFNKVFKGKDSAGSKKSQNLAVADVKSPQDEDPWLKTEVSPEEISELLRLCTKELKLRGLSTPFVLLPFRPVPDPGTPRNFIRSFFNNGNGGRMTGSLLEQELRLTDPMVLCGILKWCWGRLPGGVVTWEVYELFRVGESDSNMARDSFSTFIPISVNSQARAQIIFDFFDLFSAIAAHAKTNGLAGLKLSRLAGWWAFEHVDTGWGFDGGYSSWTRAADATMHLFFGYLRSLSPEDSAKGSSVPMLPTSLRALLHSVDYPPPKSAILQSKSVKVVMTVETVSPTPFSLLRRAKHFQFRDDDKALQAFVQFEDPIQSLTDENRRVMKCISQTNESPVSTLGISTGLRSQPSWSKFQDLGFSGVLEEDEDQNEAKEVRPEPVRSPTGDSFGESFGESFRKRAEMGASHKTGDILARPTTPSWADFMVAGFTPQTPGSVGPSPHLLPPDKQLPPIETTGSRVRSSQSNMHGGDDSLDPGELASVTPMEIDDAFWWVWMSSLSGEESSARKAVFGRCALAETKADEGRWLVLEEKVKGAAQATDDAAYIASKKGSKRGRLAKLGRRKSVGKNDAPKVIPGVGPVPPPPKPNIQPEVAARVQSVAAQIRQQALQRSNGAGNQQEVVRKSSAFQLQPVVVSEAASAMKWASKYDRDAIRDAYLKGTPPPQKPNGLEERSLPALPKEELQEKPLPSPGPPSIATPSPRPPPIEIPTVSAAQRPTSPAERRAPPPASATSPKSVQSANYVSSPEKLPKTKGSRLGKLFGRKGEKQGTSRSTTPIPEPPIRSVSSKDVSARPLATNGNGAAKSSTLAINETHLPPVPAKDPVRNDSFNTGTSSNEERTAKQVFSNFDAGPLSDMPAFVPEDSPEPSPSVTPHKNHRGLELEDGEVSPMTPTHQPPPEPEQPASPVMDRWAQIRKNAADRAKKSTFDDHTPTTSETRDTSVDDGDTSGEETIESRVARIKARVAELTGNIDSTPITIPTVFCNTLCCYFHEYTQAMLEARIEQASVLKRVVEAIKDLVQDCNFDCNDTGIALQAMDNSHVALVAMLLRADGFSPYRCDRNIALGVNLNSLTKVLRCAQNEDMITLKAEDAPDSLSLVFENTENDRISEYDIKLMDIDQEHLGIPETEYAASITLPSAEFQRICRDLSQLSESVAIEATKEGVKFGCSGDIGSGSVTLRAHQNVDKPELSTKIDLTEPVSLTFSLKYLVNFCKASSLSQTVTLSLSNEVPLLVEYKMDNGYVRFYLAPKIDEE